MDVGKVHMRLSRRRGVQRVVIVDLVATDDTATVAVCVVVGLNAVLMVILID